MAFEGSEKPSDASSGDIERTPQFKQGQEEPADESVHIKPGDPVYEALRNQGIKIGDETPAEQPTPAPTEVPEPQREVEVRNPALNLSPEEVRKGVAGHIGESVMEAFKGGEDVDLKRSFEELERAVGDITDSLGVFHARDEIVSKMEEVRKGVTEGKSGPELELLLRAVPAESGIREKVRSLISRESRIEQKLEGQRSKSTEELLVEARAQLDKAYEEAA